MVKLLHASPTMVLLATLQLKPLLSCQEGAAARGSSSVLASFWAHLKLQSAPTMVRPQFVKGDWHYTALRDGPSSSSCWHLHTLKPSILRHCLCASISDWQYGCSSPCMVMHSSLSLLVSGQAQQIFFLGLSAGGGTGCSCPFPNGHQLMTARVCVIWSGPLGQL